MKTLISFAAFTILIVSACSPAPTPTPTATPTNTNTPIATQTATTTYTPTITPTFTSTNTLTPSLTPTPSDTATPPLSPTPTLTPTPAALIAFSVGNSFCRWGPGTAYISSFTLFAGLEAEIFGRDYGADWLWLQPEGLAWKCWVATSALAVDGDPSAAPRVFTKLPTRADVPSPTGVSASRNGNSVRISWNPIPAAPQVGYLLELTYCFNGFLLIRAFSTTSTSFTIQDNTTCGSPSSGVLYGSNKLGYSFPVTIRWP